MAFKSFEPSEAMLKAMQDRLSAKAAVAAASSADAAQAPGGSAALCGFSVKASHAPRVSFEAPRPGEFSAPSVRMPEPAPASFRTAGGFTAPPANSGVSTPSGLFAAREVEPGWRGSAMAAGHYVAAAGRPTPGDYGDDMGHGRADASPRAGRPGATASHSTPSLGSAAKSGLPPRPPQCVSSATLHQDDAPEGGQAAQRSRLLSGHGSCASTPLASARLPTGGRRARSASSGVGRRPGSCASSRGPSADGSPRSSASVASELRALGLDFAGGKLPSAVTVGGVPVASDGELVYLGGGIFASALPPEPAREQRPAPAKRRPRARVLPGRVQRSIGSSSALRSASAHLVGRPSRGDDGGEQRSPRSPARSDGQIGARSAGNAVGQGPKVWRPSGPAKLPPTPEGPPAASRRALSRAEEEEELPPGVLRSAARAEAREASRRTGAGLFGGNGLLAQLRAGEAAVAACADLGLARATSSRASSCGARAVGAPNWGELRAAERQAAKEERTRLLLEERQLRLAAEAEEAALKKKKALAPLPGMTPSASAPNLNEGSGQDIMKQKLRLACQMQMLDLFSGKNVNNMSAQQAHALLSRLKGGFTPSDQDGGAPAEEAEDFGADGTADETLFAASGGVPCSIEQRLHEVNDMCNRVFEDDMEDPDL